MTRVTDFRVVMARDWNNGEPDGAERWVVFDNTCPEEGPVVCETIAQICKTNKLWTKP
jgi:hypothetical protein